MWVESSDSWEGAPLQTVGGRPLFIFLFLILKYNLCVTFKKYSKTKIAKI